MSNTISFEANDHPLSEVMFSTWKFRVPRYQRPYSWNEDQLAEFWNDLLNSDGPYFFGSFIFNTEPMNETGYVEIIDGQQRMLTVTMFIAVLRNIMRKYSSDKAHLYHIQDITILDRDGGETYRIECGDSTRTFFETHIQDKHGNITEAKPSSPEEERIKANYEYLWNKVIAEIERYETNEDKINYLHRLRQKIARLIVIRILIHGEEDAYEIFETTNARGVDLSVADLLKNLIFKKIPIKDDRDFAKEEWTDIVNNVQQTGTELKKFIRCYWISKHSMVTEKNLFREIKRQITDWPGLLDDLWTSSEWFNKLLEVNKDDWQDLKNGQKIYKSISAIRLMGLTQVYVLLLSILRNIGKINTDPTRIVQLIEKFTFAYSAVCSMPSNKVEKMYSTYARRIEDTVKKEPKKILSGKIQSIFSQLEKELIDQWPSHESFREHFSEIGYGPYPRSRDLVKYILNDINAAQTTGEHKIDFDNVNIEHILPQNPCKEWNLKKKEIKPYVNKLGNLTLVSKRFNSKVGNKTIPDKIGSYAESEIVMTKQLVDYLKELDHVWGEEQIKKRQNEFADIAYKQVWSFTHV